MVHGCIGRESFLLQVNYRTGRVGRYHINNNVFGNNVSSKLAWAIMFVELPEVAGY